MNDWVIGHLRWTDIEVEAKLKNVASLQLAEQARAKAPPGDQSSQRPL